MNLRPLHNQVIIKSIKESEAAQSGLVLPQTAEKERPEKGEVVAVGPGKLLDNGLRAPISVLVGQHIVFKKYSPDEIKIDGQEFLVIRDEDIIAIID